MMHRCNVSSCSCGQNNSSFSMMFEGDHMADAVYSSGDHMYSSFTSSSSSSSVDCTLSLGTPSTRVGNENERRPSSFGWNVAPPPPTSRNHRGGGGRSGSSNANSGGGDPLLARRCANCDTTSTPLWRNGPRGPKSLCNACGIRFKKEERRATAANGGATSQGGGGGVAVVDSSWIHHHNSQGQKMPCYSSPYGNEFRFTEDHDDHTDNAFLSWRFNVQDRPSLVHDFTR